MVSSVGALQVWEGFPSPEEDSLPRERREEEADEGARRLLGWQPLHRHVMGTGPHIGPDVNARLIVLTQRADEPAILPASM